MYILDGKLSIKYLLTFRALMYTIMEIIMEIIVSFITTNYGQNSPINLSFIPHTFPLLIFHKLLLKLPPRVTAITK